MARCVSISTLALLLALTASGCGGSQRKEAVHLRGAGASFPAALYGRWFEQFSSTSPHVQIAYEAKGSGAGKQAILDESVDFGASDAAMTEEEMAQVKRGVLLLPMTAGSVVLAYHLDGVAELRLSRAAYTGIFLGEVTRWNHPLLARCNPGVALPDQPIHLMVRGDSSGTSFAFTTHLSAISKEFAKRVGTSTRPNWPAGTACQGSESVTARIQATPGAIGYLEQGQAQDGKLRSATLENRSGKYVQPTTAAAQSALASIDLFEDLIGWIPDPTPTDAYPIVTFTWLICYKKYGERGKAEALKDLLSYSLATGQEQAALLGYVPLPDKVLRRVKALVKQIHSGVEL